MATDKYELKLRERIIKQLDDLREKVKKNEPCPEKKQDVHLLIEISDNIDNCLNHWYY